MPKSIIILFIAFGLSLKCWATHPIKISTCIITQEQDELVIKLHFFADDFGAHLNKVYGNVSLENGRDTDANVLNYIKRHFNLRINKSRLKLVPLGHTLKDNVYQLKFKAKKSIKYVEDNTSIDLTNTLLLEAFDNQTNIVRIDLKGDANYSTLKFDKDNHKLQLEL